MTAKLAQKLAVLRAVSTADSAHSSSGYYMMTGNPHVPMQVENAKPGAPNDWPHLGAVVRQLRGDRGGLPGAVRLPEHIWNTGGIPWPGQDAGFLGQKADPWLIHCDPNDPRFQIPGLSLPEEVPPVRFDGRRSLLEAVNRHIDGVDRASAVDRYDGQSRAAFNLLAGSKARQAFDLDREPAAVRDRYGRHRIAQSLLLARRLVEAGVNFVTIDLSNHGASGTWDTHGDNIPPYGGISKGLKPLLPIFDHLLTTLVSDLTERGLDKDVLVIAMGEFGRTPQIGTQDSTDGRNHWPYVMSMTLAGGGLRHGQVIGATERDAGHIAERPVTPADLAATIYRHFGVPDDAQYIDYRGRPRFLQERGQAIAELF
jgi:hypothetical protein